MTGLPSLSRRWLLALAAAACLGAARPPPPPPADPMEDIDTDNDGSISLDEADVAGAAKFDSMDTSLDGKLSLPEVKGHLSAAAFREADTDHNKFLDKPEYMALVDKRFKAADADNDGTVDLQELKTPAGRALLVLLK